MQFPVGHEDTRYVRAPINSLIVIKYNINIFWYSSMDQQGRVTS